MKLTLNMGEMFVAQVIAVSRLARANASNLVNRKKSSASDLSIEINGAAGELAFCKMFNCFPHFDVDGPDCGVDATGKNGTRVQIKTTTLKNGRLISSPRHMNRADVFVLMTGECPTFEFRGYCRARDLFMESNLTDLGHGPVYAVPQSKLKKKEE
tara:strand:+ start:157 stop:624 length:468 start_codon:yes stop_codon:yes gene_type:complete